MCGSNEEKIIILEFWIVELELRGCGFTINGNYGDDYSVITFDPNSNTLP